MAKVFEGPQKESDQTLELTRVILAPPRVVFAALTDPSDVMRYTRAKATGPRTPSAGAVFTWFAGSVQGQFCEGTKNAATDEETAVIVAKWRFRTWAEGDYALLRISLAPEGYGRSVVHFSLRHVPERDGHGFSVYETVKVGWEERIFDAMGTIMGLVTEKK